MGWSVLKVTPACVYKSKCLLIMTKKTISLPISPTKNPQNIPVPRSNSFLKMSDPFLFLQFLPTLYQCNFFDSTVLWDNLYANWKNVHSYVESFWNKNNCNKHSYIWYTNLWVVHNWSYDPGISYQSWKK